MNTRLHAAGILILISWFFCCFETLLSLCNVCFWFFGPYFQSLLEMRRQLKNSSGDSHKFKEFLHSHPSLLIKSHTLDIHAKSTCRRLAKRKKSLKDILARTKYNLKAIMRSDHKSHMGSPCLSL